MANVLPLISLLLKLEEILPLLTQYVFSYDNPVAASRGNVCVGASLLTL